MGTLRPPVLKERLALGRRAASTIAGVLAGLVFACGASQEPGKTSSGARASCAADDECVLSNSVSCCAACADSPHAIPKLAFEQQERRCSTVDCTARSERIECPKVEPLTAFVAKCKDGTCAAVKR